MPPIAGSVHDLHLIEVSNEASGLLKMARRFYRLDHDARELAEAVAAAMGSSRARNGSARCSALVLMHAIVRERMKRGDT